MICIYESWYTEFRVNICPRTNHERTTFRAFFLQGKNIKFLRSGGGGWMPPLYSIKEPWFWPMIQDSFEILEGCYRDSKTAQNKYFYNIWNYYCSSWREEEVSPHPRSSFIHQNLSIHLMLRDKSGFPDMGYIQIRF